MGAILMLALDVGLTIVSYLLKPKPRTPRPDIGDVKPPTTQVGTPIPVVFGTVRLSPSVVWWGNPRAQQTTAGTYDYGFDMCGVFSFGTCRFIRDIVYAGKSAVQYIPKRYYLNATGQQLVGPSLVSITGDQFPLVPASDGSIKTMVLDAPKLFGGQSAAGGISQSHMDWFLGQYNQTYSTTLARLIGNALAGAGGGAPVVQPDYPGLVYFVAYADSNTSNTNSGHYGTSPVPPAISAVITRCPQTLSDILGHAEYSVLGGYDANPVEALYSVLTSAEFPDGLKPLLKIPPAGIDVSSFTAACQQVYTEALLGSNPGPPVPKTNTGTPPNKGNPVFTNIAGALNAPTEQITVVVTAAAAGAGSFSVTGSVSGFIGAGTLNVPFTSDVISFLLTHGVIDVAVGDTWTFYVTQSSGAGVSFAVGSPDATAAEETIRQLLSIIDGVLFTHPETGLLTLKLCRGDYTLSAQPLLDESNSRDLRYSETSWPETFNEAVIRYTNRGVDNTIPVTAAGDAWQMTQGVAPLQNIAALQAVGGIPQLSDPIDYPMLSNGLSALVCGAKALRVVSRPRGKCEVKTTRAAHAWTPGMVFRLSSVKYQLNQKAMRISTIDYGALESGEITITAQEDVYVTRAPVFAVDPNAPRAQGPSGGISASAGLTVAISPATATIQVGQSQAYTVTASSGGVAVADTFTFTSSDPTIASVSSSGGVALGVTPGTVEITATDSAGNSAIATLIVVAAAAPALDHIEITPLTATVAPGGNFTYAARGVDQFGATYAVTITFGSGTPAAGTINSSTGVALGVAVGSSVITASGGGKSATAELIVANPVTAPPAGAQVVQAPGGLLTTNNPALANGGAGFSTLRIRKHYLVDKLLSGTGAGEMRIYGGVGAIAVSTSIAAGIITFVGTFNGGLANANFGTVSQASIAAAAPPGTRVVLYALYVGGTTVGTTAAGIALITDSGTVLFSGGLSGSSLGAVGNTDPADTKVDVGDWLANVAGETDDGVEYGSAGLSTPQNIPTLADPGQLGLNTFDASDLTAIVGTAFTSSGPAPSFIPGGTWGVAASGTPALNGLAITPASATLAVGASITVTGSGIDQFRNPITDPNPITYESANTNIATVNSTTGQVTAVAPGIADITATDGTYSATSVITVPGAGPPPGIPTGQEVGFATDINRNGKPHYAATLTIAAPGGIGVESVASQLRYIFPTATSASSPTFVTGSMDAQYAAQLANGNINAMYLFQGNAPLSGGSYDVPWYVTYIVDDASAKAAINAIVSRAVGRWKDSVAVINAMNETKLGGGYCPNVFRTFWATDPDDFTTGVIPYILNAIYAVAPSIPTMLNFGHLETDPAQRAGVLALFQGIKATNTPASKMLQRCGSEMHFGGKQVQSGLLQSNIPGYTTFADDLDAIGVDLDFTEMDYTDDTAEEAAHAVPGPEFPADYPGRDALFAQAIVLYGNFRKAIANAGRWIFWGLDSDFSWLWKIINPGTPFNRTDGQQPRADLLNSGVPSSPAAAFLALYPSLTALSPTPPSGGGGGGGTSGTNEPSGMTTVINQESITAATAPGIPTSPVSANGTAFPLGGLPGVNATIINSPTGSVKLGAGGGLEVTIAAGQQNDPAMGLELDWPSTPNTGRLYLRYVLQQGAAGVPWDTSSSGINAGSLKMWAPKDSEGNDHIVMAYGPSVGNVVVAGGWGFGVGLQGPTTQNVPNWNAAPFAAVDEFSANIDNTFEVLFTPNTKTGSTVNSDGRVQLWINGVLADDSGPTLKIFDYSGGTPQWGHLDMYLGRAQYPGGSNAAANATVILKSLYASLG